MHRRGGRGNWSGFDHGVSLGLLKGSSADLHHPPPVLRRNPFCNDTRSSAQGCARPHHDARRGGILRAATRNCTLRFLAMKSVDIGLHALIRRRHGRSARHGVDRSKRASVTRCSQIAPTCDHRGRKRAGRGTGVVRRAQARTTRGAQYQHPGKIAMAHRPDCETAGLLVWRHTRN